jgi:uncharacterized lipoprotein YajG
MGQDEQVNLASVWISLASMLRKLYVKTAHVAFSGCQTQPTIVAFENGASSFVK